MTVEVSKEGNYLKDKSQKIEHTLQDFFQELRTQPALRGFKGEDLKAALLRPAEDAVIGAGGKRLRPLWAHLSHDILGGKNRDIDRIAIMPELMHKGSVVVDDIEDHAPQSKNPLFEVYGKNLAINAGNFLYFMPQLILQNTSLNNSQMSTMLAELNRTTVVAHAGQGLDLRWSTHLPFSSLPTEGEYISMIRAKTGGIFELSAKLGAIAADTRPEKIGALGEITGATGIAYQLRDDLLSLRKGSGDYGADIIEGKVTLGLLYLAKQKPELGQKLYKIQCKAEKSPHDIEEAVALMRDGGAIDYVEKKIDELATQAKTKLHAEFPESKHRDAFDVLINACVVRNI